MEKDTVDLRLDSSPTTGRILPPLNGSPARLVIMDAAIDLFSTREYSECTMRTLAIEVGLRPASLYSHFKSKAALLEEIFDSFLQCFPSGVPPAEEVAQRVAGQPDEEILQSLLIKSSQDALQLWLTKIVRIAIRHQFEYDEARAFYCHIYHNLFIQYKKDIMAELVRRGVYRPFNYEPLAALLTDHTMMELRDSMSHCLTVEEYADHHAVNTHEVMTLLVPFMRENRLTPPGGGEVLHQ